MKPNFRYFKCKLDVEPIKSLYEQWRKDREVRYKKLDAIFYTRRSNRAPFVLME